MVKVYLADITPLLIEEIYQKCYREVPLWRREKADRLKICADRARSVGAWRLWQEVYQEVYQGVCQEDEIREDLVYNLSHSGNYVLCVYSDRIDAKVGCDLETVKEVRPALAKRFFCSGEYEHIVSQETEEARRDLFYRYWVLKESFMKATRKGMALDMRDYEIGWQKNGVPCLKKQPEEYVESYNYREYSGPVEVKIAVCSTDPEIDERLHIRKI